mmetsp:Transcript_73115/g.167717  ORF Transcript_73115/g.167717 Transcript_73115/m.167717 type:complete len:497 (-) Transcript_73115:164-1654(-)
MLAEAWPSFRSAYGSISSSATHLRIRFRRKFLLPTAKSWSLMAKTKKRFKLEKARVEAKRRKCVLVCNKSLVEVWRTPAEAIFVDESEVYDITVRTDSQDIEIRSAPSATWGRIARRVQDSGQPVVLFDASGRYLPFDDRVTSGTVSAKATNRLATVTLADPAVAQQREEFFDDTRDVVECCRFVSGTFDELRCDNFPCSGEVGSFAGKSCIGFQKELPCNLSTSAISVAQHLASRSPGFQAFASDLAEVDSSMVWRDDMLCGILIKIKIDETIEADVPHNMTLGRVRKALFDSKQQLVWSSYPCFAVCDEWMVGDLIHPNFLFNQDVRELSLTSYQGDLVTKNVVLSGCKCEVQCTGDATIEQLQQWAQGVLGFPEIVSVKVDGVEQDEDEKINEVPEVGDFVMMVQGLDCKVQHGADEARTASRLLVLPDGCNLATASRLCCRLFLASPCDSLQQLSVEGHDRALAWDDELRDTLSEHESLTIDGVLTLALRGT